MMSKRRRNLVGCLALVAFASVSSIGLWWWHHTKVVYDARGDEVRESGILNSLWCEVNFERYARLRPGQCKEVNDLLVDLLSQKGNAQDVDTGGFAAIVDLKYQRRTADGDWETVFQVESWGIAVAVSDYEQNQKRWFWDRPALDDRVTEVARRAADFAREPAKN